MSEATPVIPKFDAVAVAEQLLAKVEEIVRARAGGYGGPRPKLTVVGAGQHFQQFNVEWLGHIAAVGVDTSLGWEPAEYGKAHGAALGSALMDAIQKLPPEAKPGEVYVLKMVPA